MLCCVVARQDISISVLLLLHELTDSDVLSEREEASLIVDAIVDKQVRLVFIPQPLTGREHLKREIYSDWRLHSPCACATAEVGQGSE